MLRTCLPSGLRLQAAYELVPVMGRLVNCVSTQAANAEKFWAVISRTRHRRAACCLTIGIDSSNPAKILRAPNGHLPPSPHTGGILSTLLTKGIFPPSAEVRLERIMCPRCPWYWKQKHAWRVADQRSVSIWAYSTCFSPWAVCTNHAMHKSEVFVLDFPPQEAVEDV